MKKKFYHILYMMFAQYLPLTNSEFNKILGGKIRYWLAKQMVESIGTGVNVERKAKFPYTINIGDNSGLGVRCEINGRVYIGKDVLMGPDVIMYTVNHKFQDKNIRIIDQGYSEEKPIYIGNDVWIGRKVIILPGVHIGDGAVVGAGTVVAKDIPPYTVAVGNPMVFKKERK